MAGLAVGVFGFDLTKILEQSKPRLVFLSSVLGRMLVGQLGWPVLVGLVIGLSSRGQVVTGTQLIKPQCYEVIVTWRHAFVCVFCYTIVIAKYRSMFLFPGRRWDWYFAGMLFSSCTTGRPFPFKLQLSKLNISSVSRHKLHTYTKIFMETFLVQLTINYV